MPRDKLVYICSPYRRNVEENVKNARAYILQAMIEHPDVLPIAPHLLFTRIQSSAGSDSTQASTC